MKIYLWKIITEEQSEREEESEKYRARHYFKSRILSGLFLDKIFSSIQKLCGIFKKKRKVKCHIKAELFLYFSFYLTLITFSLNILLNKLFRLSFNLAQGLPAETA